MQWAVRNYWHYLPKLKQTSSERFEYAAVFLAHRIKRMEANPQGIFFELIF